MCVWVGVCIVRVISVLASTCINVFFMWWLMSVGYVFVVIFRIHTYVCMCLWFWNSCIPLYVYVCKCYVCMYDSLSIHLCGDMYNVHM